jgi:TerC family integral membrane protein
VNELLFWVLFNLFVLAMLAVDLWVFHRPGHTVKFREAVIWSVSWIVSALVFAGLVYFWHGRETAVEFTTGYIIELSLSVDNLFVFLLIFRYFKVPSDYQHKVLFWGIVGALVMRGVFIGVGIGLIGKFHWIIFVFGAFLVYSGIRLLGEKEMAVDPDKSVLVRAFRRVIPVIEDYEGDKFVVRRAGLYATPLLLVLIVVETTDLLFATDSIPAVLAITLKPFVVYTSNVFAILGLRSLYFVLAGMMEIFHYLHYGLAVVLIVIGGKMLASDYYEVPTVWALGAVAGVLLISIVASVVRPKELP